VVRVVLASPFYRVRPAAEPVPLPLLGSPAGKIFGQLVRMTDGPGHMPAKLAVSGHLDSRIPARVAQHGAVAARRLVEELEPARHADRIADFAFRLPVYVLGQLLGFASDRLPDLAMWTADFVRCLAPAAAPEHIEPGKVAAGHLAEAFKVLLGHSTVDAVVANRIGYLFQSYEATAGLIGNTIVALGRHRDVLTRVEAEPGFLTAVIREVVRHDPPVQNTRRFLAGPGNAAGEAMREGDVVLVVLAAANRDPNVNPDPARFDARRAERRIFTFGTGSHACPGAALSATIATAGVAHVLGTGLDLARWAGPTTYHPSTNVRMPRLEG